MDRRTGILLGVLAGLLYLLVGADKAGTDSHWPLAQAFVHGRLYLTDDYPWLELVPRAGGGWYSPFPPLPSLLLVPFAIIDVPIWTDVMAAVAGGISVTLMWLVLERLEVKSRPRLWLTVGWAFGSEALWVAGEGGQHLAPQILAAALLLAALLLGLGGRAPLGAGLLLGAAAAARLPVGLAFPVFLWLYRRGGWPLFLLGLALPVALMGAYNVARFGSPLEFGYGLITDVDGNRVLDEPWYPQGIDSVAYLPLGLYTMLFQGPGWSDAFPWVVPGWGGVSILLMMPILWWMTEARGRLALVVAASAVLVLLPDLMHGNPGFAQVGYRFVLDALPLLWMLLGIGLARGLSRAAGVALAAGVAVHAWLCGAVWLGYQT